jgi:putative ATP-binding cassette transporter
LQAGALAGAAAAASTTKTAKPALGDLITNGGSLKGCLRHRKQGRSLATLLGHRDALLAPRGEKLKAWGLLALLVILLLGQTRFAVLFNEQTGEFTSALAARDEARFWDAIRYCLGLLIAAVPIYALYYYVRDKLGIHWRRWLTDRFLDRYFSHRQFYELNANAAIDNPDQRIAEDINTFTQRSLYFLLIFIGAILQLVAFSAVLWSISHELVYFLVCYAIVGTLVTIYVFGIR